MIYPIKQVADEMDLAKWERIRQDESEAAQANATPQWVASAREAVAASPARALVRRIYIGFRAALAALLLIVVFFVVGRVEADIYEDAAQKPPLCLDLEGWLYRCDFKPQGGTRT